MNKLDKIYYTWIVDVYGVPDEKSMIRIIKDWAIDILKAFKNNVGILSVAIVYIIVLLTLSFCVSNVNGYMILISLFLGTAIIKKCAKSFEREQRRVDVRNKNIEIDERTSKTKELLSREGINCNSLQELDCLIEYFENRILYISNRDYAMIAIFVTFIISLISISFDVIVSQWIKATIIGVLATFGLTFICIISIEEPMKNIIRRRKKELVKDLRYIKFEVNGEYNMQQELDIKMKYKNMFYR